MAGKLQFTYEEFQQAAIKYRKELLMLPIIGIKETTKFMTGRPGIRYKENVATLSGNAQLAPYNPTRASDFNLNIDFRTLETYMGSVVAEFEPNSAISTLLGQGATKGDGQMKTPTALEVLALVAKGISENLNNAIWNGERNASGNTTKDLFDGFDTITQKEITSGAIAREEGNYLKLTEKITKANAVDVAKEILYSLDPRLRAQKLNLYCTQEFADLYNESYLLTHGATPYNTQFNQTAVEGSEGRLVLVPLANKAGSKFFHVAPQANMLYGYDQMSDQENVLIERYKPFILSFVATMFFGVQFESIDKRRFKAIELADDEEEGGGAGSGSGSGSGTVSGSGSGSGSDSGSGNGSNESESSSNSSSETSSNVTLTVNIASYCANQGKVSINGGTLDNTEKTLQVAPGTQVTIKADPLSGYNFCNWQDGDHNAQRTVTVSADTTYTAEFEES